MEKDNIMKKINYYEKQIKILHDDLKKNDFPKGALLYILDYSENDTEIYRIGKTDDLKKRKQIYDTHTLHKKNVIHYIQVENPLKLELCVRSMLYDFRYKNKKDFYICNLDIIKESIKICIKDQNNINKQNQKNQLGGNGLNDSKILDDSLIELKKKHNEIDAKINKLNFILSK